MRSIKSDESGTLIGILIHILINVIAVIVILSVIFYFSPQIGESLVDFIETILEYFIQLWERRLPL